MRRLEVVMANLIARNQMQAFLNNLLKIKLLLNEAFLVSLKETKTRQTSNTRVPFKKRQSRRNKLMPIVELPQLTVPQELPKRYVDTSLWCFDKRESH